MDDFQQAFNDADMVLALPVYAAGESPIEGADHEALAAGIRARGHRSVAAMAKPEELAGMVRDLARPGDYVVCLGAGNITQWAYALPGGLAQGDKAAAA